MVVSRITKVTIWLLPGNQLEGSNASNGNISRTRLPRRYKAGSWFCFEASANARAGYTNNSMSSLIMEFLENTVLNFVIGEWEWAKFWLKTDLVIQDNSKTSWWISLDSVSVLDLVCCCTNGPNISPHNYLMADWNRFGTVYQDLCVTMPGSVIDYIFFVKINQI